MQMWFEQSVWCDLEALMHGLAGATFTLLCRDTVFIVEGHVIGIPRGLDTVSLQRCIRWQKEGTGG